MNEFKGTPGPWRLMPFSDSLRIDSQNSIVAFGADKGNLSMVCQGGDLMSKWEEERANAQLIATAPELLEALQQLLADSESDQVTLDAEYGMARNIDEIEKNGDLPASIVMARKAIAKALGETK